MGRGGGINAIKALKGNQSITKKASNNSHCKNQ